MSFLTNSQVNPDYLGENNTSNSEKQAAMFDYEDTKFDFDLKGFWDDFSLGEGSGFPFRWSPNWQAVDSSVTQLMPFWLCKYRMTSCMYISMPSLLVPTYLVLSQMPGWKTNNYQMTFQYFLYVLTTTCLDTNASEWGSLPFVDLAIYQATVVDLHSSTR